MQQLELKHEALAELDKTVGKLGILSYIFYINMLQYPFRDPKVMIPKIDKLISKFEEYFDEYRRVRSKVREVLEV